MSIDTTGANSDIVELVNDSRSAAGYMIFVGIFAILFELTLIVVRFINLGAVNHFFCIFVILVSGRDCGFLGQCNHPYTCCYDIYMQVGDIHVYIYDYVLCCKFKV